MFFFHLATLFIDGCSVGVVQKIYSFLIAKWGHDILDDVDMSHVCFLTNGVAKDWYPLLIKPAICLNNNNQAISTLEKKLKSHFSYFIFFFFFLQFYLADNSIFLEPIIKVWQCYKRQGPSTREVFAEFQHHNA